MIKVDWHRYHAAAFKDRRCIVTGGAGFIGSHLVDALVDLGASVVVVDDLSSGRRENLNTRAEFVHASVLDRDALSQAMRGADIVFHEAAKVSVPASMLDPVGYHQVNVNGTLEVLEAARHADVKRLLFAASSSAYGDSSELPKRETMAPNSISPYAANKICGEQLLRAFSASYPIDTVNLRYFNIFGPRQRADSPYSGVIAKFISVLKQGQAPTITGDGSATRDFTFVANAVHANLLAARHPTRVGGEVFNVATGLRTSVLELALTLARVIGRDDLKPGFGPTRPGDVPHSQADLDRIRRTFGYEVIVGFEDGLRATVEG
jgi:UDP-glucose 4-epimerase